MSSLKLAVWATVGGLCLSVIASPALAASLPDDQDLYGYTHGGSVTTIGAAGEIVPIGVDTGITVLDLAFDPASQLVYGIDDNSNPCSLFAVNLESGLTTMIGPIRDGLTTFTKCGGVAFAPTGELWVTVGGTGLARVNKTDATVLELHEVTGYYNNRMYSLAIHPTTGTFYAIEGADALYVIDATWNATFIQDTKLIYGGEFDSTGQFWHIGPGRECGASLYSADLDDYAATKTGYGDMFDSAGECDVFQLFITPTAAPASTPTPSPAPTTTAAPASLPTLADTGSTPSGALAVVALLLLATGLVVGSRALSAKTGTGHTPSR